MAMCKYTMTLKIGLSWHQNNTLHFPLLAYNNVELLLKYNKVAKVYKIVFTVMYGVHIFIFHKHSITIQPTTHRNALN